MTHKKINQSNLTKLDYSHDQSPHVDTTGDLSLEQIQECHSCCNYQVHCSPNVPAPLLAGLGLLSHNIKSVEGVRGKRP